MSNWKHNLKGNLWLKGQFGLEKENIRVDQNGHLAQMPHPDIFGDKLEHPYITTDFSESQVEMVTPPLPNIREALGFLETIQDVVQAELGNDLLWPQSMPPILPEDDAIPIARYSNKGKDKETYREMLTEKYGKRNQMISGIHFNFSFDESLLQALYQSDSQHKIYEQFREAAYLKAIRQMLRYRWLYILLFGNSPIVDASARLRCGKPDRIIHEKLKALSIRNSCYGYRNIDPIYPDYQSIDDYLKSLEKYILSGTLTSAKELYTPVRLKFEPDSHRISYLEFRFLDINPLTKTGLTVEALTFLHLMAIYGLISQEPGPFSAKEQAVANWTQANVAFSGLSPHLQLEDNHSAWALAQAIVQQMQKMVIDLKIETPDVIYTLETVLAWIDSPSKRDVHVVLDHIESQGFIPWHLEMAQQYAEDSQTNNYRFHGLENMELSTQLVLREAVRRGISFEILDRQSNFIRLERNGHVQIIQQATKTSLDNYASILAMENKAITKKILSEHGITTPAGTCYHDPETALQDFVIYVGQPIVVKPLSTNFGKGITMIPKNEDKNLFKQAVENAFKDDTSILVENWIHGKEYRFFVMGDTVAGILHRVPANVVGDGDNTIEALIHEKNKNPLRGKGYRTPLEKIKMGETEALFLKMQNKSFLDVPVKDEIVYLRENSNISTGGDSIDVTDDIHPSYKHLAVQAAKAMNVKITGLDMIIQNPLEEASDDNYAIIELNFNPAIHIHCHPYQGKNRRLNERLLDMLGYPLPNAKIHVEDLLHESISQLVNS